MKKIHRILTHVGIICSVVFTVVWCFGNPFVANAATTNSFYYTFNNAGTLYETGDMSESTSPYWWVNSGAMFSIDGTTGSTIQGSLPESSRWRLIYLASNPVDTDQGYHPQNIFRLLTKSEWQNVRTEGWFRLIADHLSTSPNRNESNGILLFNRYQDSNNLYYAGIRVDGAAVIKKKIGGVYYTMAYKKIFFYPGPYDRVVHPDLIPKNTWIGLRSEVINNADGSVTVKLFTDVAKTGLWTLVLEVKDDGVSFGGPAILNAGYAGIRTDFMDVLFDNFKLTSV